MEDNPTLKAMLRSALAYGAGFAGGFLLIAILLNNPIIATLVNTLDKLQIFLKLFFTIFLILFTVGLGGGVAGLIGGYGSWQLTAEHDAQKRRRFVWRSGLSFFITHALLLIPFLLLAVVIGFLNPDIDVKIFKLPSLFASFGIAYGAVGGLLLGWLTAGLRQIIRVLVAAIIGFGVGGWLFGLCLYLLSQQQPVSPLSTAVTILVGMFLFGAAGGGALGLAYRNIRSNRALFPNSRAWQIISRVALILIAIVFAMALGKLVRTFTIRPASVAEMLSLPTQGTHWLPTDAPATTSLPQTADVEALCTPEGQILVTINGVIDSPPATPPCETDPVWAEDVDGAYHLIWQSDVALKQTGALTAGNYLYETILRDDIWTQPTIIATLNGPSDPVVTAVAADTLHLTWTADNAPRYATFTPYSCAGEELTPIGEIVFAVVRQEKYHPASDPIPYCKNHFDRLLYTPNPTAPNAIASSSEHGAFDDIAESAANAQYEVLFTTMQWDKPSEKGSPGSVMAQAVAALYEKVKANPDAYPRGMTVRILLGNIPDLAIFEPTTQIYHVLQDLRDAGVSEMVNEEIGWHLEVANFDGIWPHAHSKFIVIDGKTAAAAGFNYSYLHLPTGHPSGQGLDMTDKGIQFTGPVAQSVMSAYDDLWSGSDVASCRRFPPPIPALAFLWCDTYTAEATHPPEVLRFYPTEGNANAFSLHHTSAFLQSDEAIASGLRGAQESIDLFEVNFSLQSVCVVILLLDGTCDYDNLIPEYMKALVTAVVENDVHVRVIVEPSAMNGLENRIAIRWLTDELEQQGKLDNLEIKFSENKMHDKAVLIDEEFLIVGSQNFHWSAWGSPSLTEYNIATDDAAAVAEFLQEFEYQWSIGVPVQEQMLP